MRGHVSMARILKSMFRWSCFLFFMFLSVWRRSGLVCPRNSLQLGKSDSVRGFPDTSLTFGVYPSFFREMERALLVHFRQRQEGVVVVLCDARMGQLLPVQLCSLLRVGTEGYRIVFVVFDEETYRVVGRFGHLPLLMSVSRNFTKRDRYRMKLVLAYFVLSLGLDCVVVDSDVIFLGSLSRLWQFSADMEVASDTPGLVRATDFTFPGCWCNSGLVRLVSNVRMVNFMKAVVVFAIKNPHWKDQDVFKRFLRTGKFLRGRWWIPFFNVTLRVIDPVLAPTGSVLFCRGREALKAEARKLGVRAPVAVHFNWHLYVQSKLRTIRILGWSLENGVCPEFNWPFWTTEAFPRSIVCCGRAICLYDRSNATQVIPYRDSLWALFSGAVTRLVTSWTR